MIEALALSVVLSLLAVIVIALFDGVNKEETEESKVSKESEEK